MRFMIAVACLPATAALRLNAALGGNRAAATTAAAFAATLSAAAVASDLPAELPAAVTASSGDIADFASAIGSAYNKYLAQPGLEIQYGEYLDNESGQFVRPVEGAKLTSSGPLLLLGAGATRCGGILPDEMPFNIVQKALRAVLPAGVMPDLRDGDMRKDYQDTCVHVHKSFLECCPPLHAVS